MLHRLQLPNQLAMLLLGWDGLLQLCLCLCLCQLLFGLRQRLPRVLHHGCVTAAVALLFGLLERLTHVLYQRFSCVNCTHSSIVVWVRLLNELEQSRMGVTPCWCR